MRVRVTAIDLIGAERRFEFTSGLNIIAGPIATGKTTLLRCIRAVLGSGIVNFPREARETITALASEIIIGSDNYDIVRPFVTTRTARVDVAGPGEARRLPAIQTTSPSEISYGRWLLEKMNLPVLEVPRTPTRQDSDLTPVSINDFMLYCYLRQDEIDNNVFGHDNRFKNTKRKYVFEIAYGKYNVKLAQLYESLREVSQELSRLRAKTVTIDEFLESTPFENRALLEREIRDLNDELLTMEKTTTEETQEIVDLTQTGSLRQEIQTNDEKLTDLAVRLDFEQRSQSQMEQLLAQLQTQSKRITRSIVADKYLLDFDFIMCPRCGSTLVSDRGSDDICYLCLQEPEPKITRADLINEQDRLERQIIETQELITVHSDSQESLESEIIDFRELRHELSEQLDFLTSSYVSDSASKIAAFAEKRAGLQERRRRFSDYLQLIERRGASENRISELETRKEVLEATIDSIISSETGIEERIQFLEARFKEILEGFGAPRFVESGYTGIDRRTYLPLFEGRRFDELQSQGLKVIINVSHALAHQLTAMEYGLDLPNILLIDGITANIGHEGLDWERVEAIFDYLISLSDSHGDNLQLIIAENSVPVRANEYIRVILSEDDKLIPEHLLIQES